MKNNNPPNNYNDLVKTIHKIKQNLVFDPEIDPKRDYYDINRYFSLVKNYAAVLLDNNIKKKSIFIYINLGALSKKEIKDVMYSLAPLSHALHILGNDLFLFMPYYQDVLPILMNIYGLYIKRDKDLLNFINFVGTKIKQFKNIFKPPHYLITLNQTSKGMQSMNFVLYDFRLALDQFKHSQNHFVPYKLKLKLNAKWLKEHKPILLQKTSYVLLKQLYNIKPNEPISLGFDLVPAKPKLPLQDYLDSFQIICAFLLTSIKLARLGSLKAYTQREKITHYPNPIAELINTLIGCELSKWSNEKVFKLYNKISMLIKADKLIRGHARAVFFISGEGTYGKHLFGETIGYPVLSSNKKPINKKLRWTSPGMIIYQFPWYKQSLVDKRKPLARVGFTETLPIDIFIRTNYIDWLNMDKRNHKIIKLLSNAKEVIVRPHISSRDNKNNKSLGTSLRISLAKEHNRSRFLNSGADIRTLYNRYWLKKGLYVGNMANIPGGEVFTTPLLVHGLIVGDVVISIDKSYPLLNKKPLIIKCDGNTYKIIDGDKEIIKKIKEKRREAWHLIKRYEKYNVISKDLIKVMKDNFYRIGEFAINTHPKAQLCRYLIVNEKIANMIHLALGSGFEAKRNTTYHYDIVINAKKQRLDIFGIDSRGNKLWVMRNGKFVV